MAVGDYEQIEAARRRARRRSKEEMMAGIEGVRESWWRGALGSLRHGWSL
jgi:hypothetical protein